jgi:hypothetical protein
MAGIILHGTACALLAFIFYCCPYPCLHYLHPLLPHTGIVLWGHEVAPSSADFVKYWADDFAPLANSLEAH